MGREEKNCLQRACIISQLFDFDFDFDSALLFLLWFLVDCSIIIMRGKKWIHIFVPCVIYEIYEMWNSFKIEWFIVCPSSNYIYWYFSNYLHADACNMCCNCLCTFEIWIICNNFVFFFAFLLLLLFIEIFLLGFFIKRKQALKIALKGNKQDVAN